MLVEPMPRMRETHRANLQTALPVVVLLSVCALIADTSAQEAEGLLPPLFWDRIDQNAVWRLSDHVSTDGGPAPAEPKPVYLQFGFLRCPPCVVLANVANEEFGDEVERVYVHLDDLMLQEGYTNRRLWTELLTHAQAPPYDTFVTVRRGTTRLMRQLCGEEANAPSGLLVLRDGTVFEVLRAPSEDEARASFRRFIAVIEGAR